MVEIRLHDSQRYDGKYDSTGVFPDVGDVVRLRLPTGDTFTVRIIEYVRGSKGPIVRYQKINDLLEQI